MNNTNIVNLVGTIVSYEYSHTVHDEDFYMVYLVTKRLSGVTDTLPVLISYKLIDFNTDMTGQRVEVNGSFRSYNLQGQGGEERKSRLILYVFANSVEPTDKEDNNNIILDGYLCREPVYRKTPLDREVTDLLLAVNNKHNKSYYIPVITWGRNAVYTSYLKIGVLLAVTGRIQSREYIKYTNGAEAKLIAYEVSASQAEVIQAEVIENKTK